MKVRVLIHAVALWGIAGILTACSTLTDTKKTELNRMADQTRTKMILANPGMQADLGMSAGYLVIQRSGSGVPMVGKRGTGILTPAAGGERAYVRITELEVDGAWGVGDYTGFMLIRTQEDYGQAATNSLAMENRGKIYLYAKDEPVASYSIKKLSIEPRDP